MAERGKYLITARMEANGVVQRSDVVGAIFGQTEGLLGERLDLRTLQDSERVSRLEVDVTSKNGRSIGEIAIKTSLDRVETAIIAAALETIEQVGPCQATVEVESIDDVRAAKRQEVVDRATELLAIGFQDAGLSSREIVEAVRSNVSIEDITEFEGQPAGPGVASDEHIILVEGRADVRRLLQCGIDNALGVEGTNVPDSVIDLTQERTITAFFDGDRGGNLLLLELAQVGDVDYVTFAPPGSAVENLSRADIHTALEERVPYEDVEESGHDTEPEPTIPAIEAEPPTDGDAVTRSEPPLEADQAEYSEPSTTSDSQTMADHIQAVIGERTGGMRAIDGTYDVLAESDNFDLPALVTGLDEPPYAVIIDGTLEQSTVDAAARLGVTHLISSNLGEFTKRPVGVRVHAARDVLPEVDLLA